MTIIPFVKEPETGGPEDPPDYTIACGFCDCEQWEIALCGDVICAGCGSVAEDVMAVFPEE